MLALCTRLHETIEHADSFMTTTLAHLANAEKSIRLFDELLPDYVLFTLVKKADFLLWSKGVEISWPATYNSLLIKQSA